MTFRQVCREGTDTSCAPPARWAALGSADAADQQLLWDRHRDVLPRARSRALPRPLWRAPRLDLHLLTGGARRQSASAATSPGDPMGGVASSRAPQELGSCRARGEIRKHRSSPLASSSMGKIVHVTDVRHLGGHRLHLGFDDGASGEVDFSKEDWGGIFTPLSDPAYFGSVELDEELGTIVWPNGADMAPETLHRLVGEQPGAAAVSLKR